MDIVNQKKKLTKVLSTKLSIEDYNSFLILTKLEYEAQLIKDQSPSEITNIYNTSSPNPTS